MPPARRLLLAVLAAAAVLLAPSRPAAAQLAPTADSIATLRAELEQVAGTGDSLLMAGAFERVGRAYWRADRFDEAITFLLTAREIFAGRRDLESVARISNALGSSHYHLGNYELALQSYVRALEIRVADGNALGQAYVHANIAKAYQDWGQLEQALTGLIPICASCKNVRDDAGFWRSVEEYVGSRSAAQFSHSICNTCGPKLYGDYWESPTGAAR